MKTPPRTSFIIGRFPSSTRLHAVGGRYPDVDFSNLIDFVVRLRVLYEDLPASNEVFWNDVEFEEIHSRLRHFISRSGLQDAVLTSSDTEKLTALFSVLCDMVSEHLDMLLDEPDRALLSKTIGSLDDLLEIWRTSERDMTITEPRVWRMMGVWRAIWRGRDRYFGDWQAQDPRTKEVFSDRLVRALHAFVSLCHTRQCIPLWGTWDVDVARISLLAWFHQPENEEESWGDPMGAVACESLAYCLYYADSSQTTVISLAQELMHTHGDAAFLSRLCRDLENITIRDERLHTCVRVTADLVDIPTLVRRCAQQVRFSCAMLCAYERQEKTGTAEQGMLVWVKIFNLYMLYMNDPCERIAQCLLESFVPFLSRGAVLYAHNAPEDADECVEVLQDFIILALRYQNAHRGYGKMVYASLQYMAKADWQSTLQSLRDVIRRHRIPPKALGDLLTSWRLFGATLGFNETPSGARSSFCGSNKCKYHKTIAPFRMRRSCVCKRVRYCDGRCQQRDWAGGHKVSCPRARTIRGRLLKAKVQKHQREHSGEPI